MNLNKTDNVSGIYILYNVITERFYIGSSISIYRRIQAHKSDLSRHKHPSVYMQIDYDTYGWDSFECKILEKADNDSLKEREEYYLEKYVDIEKGYNNTIHYRGVCVCSSETKELMRNKKLGNKNPNFGKKFSLERRQKISNSLKGKTYVKDISCRLNLSKLSIADVVDIYNRSQVRGTLSELAKEYGVCKATISNIKNKKHPYFDFIK